LIEPQPVLDVTADLPQLAVEALEAANKAPRSDRGWHTERAHAFARACDWTAAEWFYWEGDHRAAQLAGGTKREPFTGDRAARNIPASLKREVAQRDHYRCRYCQLRVISSATMTKLEQRLPAALLVGAHHDEPHSMRDVLRLTWDHITPRASGGQNTRKNIVTACGGCNFNKGERTLDELRLRSPLDHVAIDDGWDGLNGRLGSRPI
jgi:5-methylcytosine-specific restriction endonuclease McrA